MERPIPRLAPVTRATLPLNSFILCMVNVRPSLPEAGKMDNGIIEPAWS
jgi:hypothetical protein